MNQYIFGAYPAFLLFIPPVWLWMLWHFSAVAFEMDVMLKTVSAKNEEHLTLVRRVWRLFTHLTIAYVISCLIHGAMVLYWSQNDYPQPWFWASCLPAGVFIFFSRALEPYFCRWRAEVSGRLPL
jgi:hypothetical protein